MNTYWISEATPTGHIGVYLVEAKDPKSALIKAKKLGLNTKNHLEMLKMGDDLEAKAEIAHWGVNRFIPSAELITKGYQKTKVVVNTLPCDNCGKDCFKDPKDYYMVNDTVWLSVMPTKQGILCMDCLETKLGRKLKAEDIPNCPLNYLHNPYTNLILTGRQ